MAGATMWLLGVWVVRPGVVEIPIGTEGYPRKEYAGRNARLGPSDKASEYNDHGPIRNIAVCGPAVSHGTGSVGYPARPWS